MRKFFHGLIYLIALTVWNNTNAQNNYPQNYFSSPLPVPLKLSGNFGEIRSNHFHSGLDLKTDGHEGMPVLAAASGYVSRIKVSATGFGKALYITHPNGYITVYGHLYSYAEKIDSLVKIEQHKTDSYETEFFLPKDSVIISKGEIIGLSGNSGGSEGPHLHFEIREEKTEIPCNPLLFGIQITDTIAPQLKKVIIYPLSGTVNGSITKQEFYVEKNKDSTGYISQKITCNGQIAFGFEATDKAENDSSSLGIYRAELSVDNEIIYSYQFDKFSFDETKYVNAHIDYAIKTDSAEIIEKNFLLPGNLFSCYNVINKGIIITVPGKKYHILLSLFDFAGNVSRLIFEINGRDSKAPLNTTQKGNLFHWDKKNRVETENFKLEFPANAFYENFYFSYKTDSLPDSLLYLGEAAIPIHLSGTLQIKVPDSNDVLNRFKVVAQIRKTDTLSIGGIYDNGSIKTRISRFGKFTLLVDTVAPSVLSSEIVADTICNCKKVVTRFYDNLSGMVKYRSTINGNSLISEYDLKTSSIITFLPEINFQKFLFGILLTDKKGNSSVFEKTFEIPD